MKKEIKIAFKTPLNELDTVEQTYGCRANNPDICKNNSIPNVCAFEREDCICKQSSKAWKKQYLILKEDV